MTRLVRYGLLASAVLVAAWFLVGVRQAHDLQAATTALSRQSSLSKSGGRHTASLLSSADVLYPGVEGTLLTARLEMERHDYVSAKQLVEQATAAEPENLEAWISAIDLTIADPSAMNTKQVVARLRELDPLDLRKLAP